MATINPWEGFVASPASMRGRRVDASHPRDWFWCVEPGGRYGLALYQVSDRQLPQDLSELHGLTATIRENSDGTRFLLLLLESGTDWELFLALCQDLVASTKRSNSPDNALDVAVTRLRRWQKFLSRGRRPGLTDEEARGLLGELIFLRDELCRRAGIQAAVQSWAGPEGHPQDFALGDFVFEIKSRVPSSREVVEITSAEQLQSSSGKFFLVVQELAPIQKGTAGNVTLALMVTAIRGQVESAGGDMVRRFDDLLDAVGYEDGVQLRRKPISRCRSKVFPRDEVNFLGSSVRTCRLPFCAHATPWTLPSVPVSKSLILGAEYGTGRIPVVPPRRRQKQRGSRHKLHRADVPGKGSGHPR